MRILNRFNLGFMMAAALLLAGGCAKNPEPAVRQRAQAFTQLLTKDRFEEAVAFFDPDIAARIGPVPLAEAFKSVMNAGKRANEAARRKPDGFQIRTIYFNDDKNQATVHIVFFTTDAYGSDRQEFSTDQKWVLKKAVWYLTQ